MDLFLSLLAPRVQRVVHHHPVLQHFMIVWKIARQAERHGGQPRSLGREVEPRRIRTADDHREPLQRGI